MISYFFKKYIKNIYYYYCQTLEIENNFNNYLQIPQCIRHIDVRLSFL